EEWDIASLPGSVFDEEPTALRLRFSTSLLCEPERATSVDEREATLWSLLDQAETLQLTDEKRQLSLPALERAQARLTEMIHGLGQLDPSHVQSGMRRRATRAGGTS